MNASLPWRTRCFKYVRACVLSRCYVDASDCVIVRLRSASTLLCERNKHTYYDIASIRSIIIFKFAHAYIYIRFRMATEYRGRYTVLTIFKHTNHFHCRSHPHSSSSSTRPLRLPMMENRCASARRTEASLAVLLHFRVTKIHVLLCARARSNARTPVHGCFPVFSLHAVCLIMRARNAHVHLRL